MSSCTAVGSPLPVVSVGLKLSVSTWTSGTCSLFMGMLLGSVGLHIQDKTDKQKSSNRTLSRMRRWASLDPWWGWAWLGHSHTARAGPAHTCGLTVSGPAFFPPSNSSRGNLAFCPARSSSSGCNLSCYPKDLAPLASFLSRTCKWPHYSLLTPPRCLWAAQTCPSREKHNHLFPSLAADSGALDWDCGLALSNVSLALPSDFYAQFHQSLFWPRPPMLPDFWKPLYLFWGTERCLPQIHMFELEPPVGQCSEVGPLGANWVAMTGLVEAEERTSLVVQWLRICLPVQGTQVWSLVWEDPTCHKETKSENHSHWSPCSGACALQEEKPPQWGGHTPQLENSPHSWQLEQCSNEGPVQPKISPWVNKSIKRRAERGERIPRWSSGQKTGLHTWSPRPGSQVPGFTSMALEQGTRVCLLVSQCTINSPWSPGNRPLCVKHPHSLCSLFLINSLLSEILCLEILFQPPHTPCHHMLQPRASAAKKKKKKIFF